MSTLDERFAIYQFLQENTTDEQIRSDIMNESVQEEAASKMLGKMLELTVGRYNKLDFKEIEKSRGDVTECKFYKNLRDSIDTLCDIDASTHNIPAATVVSTALNNLYTLKNEFVAAYRSKNALAILLYNTIYYTIIEATSYLIATSIEFATDGKSIKLDSIDTNSSNTLLVSNLEKFNKEVASGRVVKFVQAGKDIQDAAGEETTSIDEAVDFGGALKSIITYIKGTKIAQFAVNAGSFAAKAHPWIIGISAAIYLLINIIPIIKSCIYMIFKIRHSVSESAKMQAELLELNITELENNGGDEKVIEKQKAYAEKFRRRARRWALECDNAESDAKKDERSDNLNVNALLI